MKKLVLFFSLIIATTSYAVQLHNYADIKSAISTGQSIKILVYPNRCKETHARGNRFFMLYSDKSEIMSKKSNDDQFIEYVPDKFFGGQFGIMTTNVIFLKDPAGQPRYVWNTFEIVVDNHLEWSVELLQAPDYKSSEDPKDKWSANCKIDVGFKVFTN